MARAVQAMKKLPLFALPILDMASVAAAPVAGLTSRDYLVYGSGSLRSKSPSRPAGSRDERLPCVDGERLTVLTKPFRKLHKKHRKIDTTTVEGAYREWVNKRLNAWHILSPCKPTH